MNKSRKEIIQQIEEKQAKSEKIGSEIRKRLKSGDYSEESLKELLSEQTELLVECTHLCEEANK